MFTIYIHFFKKIKLQDKPGEVYDPITPYLEALEGDNPIPVVTAENRVRSKAYHDMRNYCMGVLGYSKETATEKAGMAGRYHLKRWREAVGLPTGD